MGLFQKLGRQVERLKQDAKAAAEEDAEYECTACGARFYTHHEQCPECGAERVVSLDRERSRSS